MEQVSGDESGEDDVNVMPKENDKDDEIAFLFLDANFLFLDAIKKMHKTAFKVQEISFSKLLKLVHFLKSRYIKMSSYL